jgi:hypothetical protein
LLGWTGISSDPVAELILNPNGANGISSALAASASPEVGGNDQGQGAPPLCQTKTVHCVLAPVSDSVSTDALKGEPVRSIVYGVYYLNQQTNTLEPKYRSATRFNIVNVESYVSPPNTDTGAVICLANSANSSCTGQSNIDDNLAEPNQNLTLSVTQTFYVNRQQVPVFWPASNNNGGFNWFGSPKQGDLGAQPPQPSQQATTNGRAVGVIQQLDVDPQSKANCKPDDSDNSFNGGCSKTAP